MSYFGERNQERNFRLVSEALPFKKGSAAIACVTYVFISQSTVEVRKDTALLRYRHCSLACFPSLLT